MARSPAAAPGRSLPMDETRRFTRSLVTPEGVDLGVRIATAGERAGAFLIDALIMMITMIVMTITVSVVGLRNVQSFDIVAIVWLVGFFVLRNFYFFIFELGARAATPGKRILKIRVTSRGGGALKADAIFARNAMREIEVFLPISMMAANAESVDGWIALAGFIWAIVFVFFPLFNKDRLRAGDIIAGTWVVQTPRRALLSDLAARPDIAAHRKPVLDRAARRLWHQGAACPRKRTAPEHAGVNRPGGGTHPQEDRLDQRPERVRWRVPARLLHRAAQAPRIQAADGPAPR